MAEVGGGIIRDYSFTRAWGVNPSAASGTALLDIVGGGPDSFNISVGDYVVYSFGSVATFSGIVTEVQEAQDFGRGREQTFSIADNRIRLAYQWCFGAFNIEDDTVNNTFGRATSPAAGSSSGSNGTDSVSYDGIGSPAAPVGAGSVSVRATPWTQRRRYRHLLPQHWQSGLWTYTDAPLTTTQILNHAFNYAWGDFGFTRNYHSALNSVILTGLDYSTGIRLSNLVSEINSKCGLDIRIDGSRTLVWGRKGEGLPPVRDDTSTPWSNGLSLSANDTGVRVVGERTRIQTLNINLVPDWAQAWNAFIDEAAWRREVATTFDLPTASKSDQLDLSAFARQVTVYQYAKEKNNESFLDARPFGKISRNHLPAWVYIRELVYRSYRIPLDYTLYGVPLSSLEIADSLLVATDVEGEGISAKQRYANKPVQFYPAAQASAIVRGQPLDLINARDIRLFYRNSTGDLRNEWTTAPDFEVDAIGKSIRFAVPTFIDGDPANGQSIYLKINQGEGGGEDLSSKVSQGSDYLDIVVPNPDFVITPAQIKASFCFLVGRFFKDYGSGPRRGAVSSQGIDLHLLDTNGATSIAGRGFANFPAADTRLPDASGSFLEILYQDGKGVRAKADSLADSAIMRQSVQASGGFTRNGVVATALTPVVDRITVNINHSTGVTEQVEFTKARPTNAAFAENTLQRIQRTEELFAGQDALKREIREYRLMAHAERRPAASRDRSRRTMSDALNMPVGGESPQVHSVKNNPAAAPAGGWKAGHLVWLDAAGVPTTNEGAFGGVLVAKPKVGATELPIAYAGRVPVRVAAGLPFNSTVVANPGDSKASDVGSVTIGRLAHGEDAPSANSGELLAMVDLGGGGGGAGVLPPFHVRLFSGDQDPINYWMTVTPGRVTDHIPYEGADALAIWIPFNLKYRQDEEDLDAEPPIIAGDLRRFPIIPGQCLAVKVMVTREGAIGPDPDAAEPLPPDEAVEIVVVDVSETSSHYVPVVADGEGGVGVYFYHLAELKEPEVLNDPPEMELILSGSHIEHWRERPAMTSTGSGQEVLKEYDVDTDTYKFRTIVGGLDLGSGGSGDGQISVSETEDEVFIRGNNIDGSLTITVDGDSPQTLEWEDGLILTEDSLTIDIPAPYEFPGGGTGSLTITTDGGSPQTLAWANGLVTTNEILGADIPVIPDIPPPLPAGDTNKLMIHNGTAWVALDAPPATGTHVLGCVDNVVQWLATEECP